MPKVQKDLLNMMSVIVARMGLDEVGVRQDYEKNKLQRTEVDGLIVSTIWTDDYGYETAVVDTTRTSVVERYKLKEEAVKGHEAWTLAIVGASSVTDVGYGDSIAPFEHLLVR